MSYKIIKKSIEVLKMIIYFFFTVSIITNGINAQKSKGVFTLLANPYFRRPACADEDVRVSLSYEPGRPPDEENSYWLSVLEEFPKHTHIHIKFDSPATLTIDESTRKTARIEVNQDHFTIVYFAASDWFGATVQGPPSGTVPYVTSFEVNGLQYCQKPELGILDKYIQGYQNSAQISLSVPDDTCGRRKVTHTELITNGLRTKPGDWPWHVALYKLEKQSLRYICGGTLISKTMVLTAAHCVTTAYNPSIPELFSVSLGRYNLIGGDIGSQEKEVHQVIVHENFERSRLDNDIALLKLKSEVQFSDYVQPICLWKSLNSKNLPSSDINGIVTGWGYDETDNLSTRLHQSVMPKVTEVACIKSNPLFYSRLLNDKKFCAGFKNGSAACNGDSGGGYVVFVPDLPNQSSPNATGTWHIRGIISVAPARRNVALCDPNQYVIFTDLEKYSDWINIKMLQT